MDRIEEAHPLKQGLKHMQNIEGKKKLNIEEAHPLKQGLKQKWLPGPNPLEEY